MSVHAQCGGLEIDGITIITDPTTKAIKTNGELLMDIVPFVSVPTTFSTLSVAQAISEKLRDAMINAGVMLADV